MHRLCSISAPTLLILAAYARGDAPPPGTGGTEAPTPNAVLDMTALEQRLRETDAIGLFTKLSLKNQVDDLLTQFRRFYSGRSNLSLDALRQKFEVLLLKVVTLVQDDDPHLAAAISASREAIWGVLSDPKRFANI
jgi:hypothetical protein